jgi:hypothetical protein
VIYIEQDARYPAETCVQTDRHFAAAAENLRLGLVRVTAAGPRIRATTSCNYIYCDLRVTHCLT